MSEVVLYRQFINNKELFDKDNIVLLFTAYEEMENPFNHFEEKENINFALSEKAGWFIAEVTAYKDGVEGRDYLGCCSYRTFEDFLNEKDGYITDMINNAVKDLKDSLNDK